MRDLSAFKAYDIRGKVPQELNEEMAYQVGLTYATKLKPDGAVATGRDIRDSSLSLQTALNEGLTDGGVNVVDIGLCGTESIYYASSVEGAGGGIMVTASHNPKGYNGLKLVGKGGAPLTGEKGLTYVRDCVAEAKFEKAGNKGSVRKDDYSARYVQSLLKIANPGSLKGLKVVANAGNGCAGPTAKMLFDHLECEVIWVHAEPDSDFPNGIPNPLLIENREATAKAVRDNKADLGIAWDGDFDRCFFFDSEGEFIEGYYLVGFLSEAALILQPGSTVIHDPRLFWNTQDIAKNLGGKAVMSKTGHAFIKETMRKENAVYGGEMSAHHYFREFSYCDSGMLPWLMVMRIMHQKKAPLASLVSQRQAMFPCSGEINFTVNNAPAVIDVIRKRYEALATDVCTDDGISMIFNNAWRVNLRASNTEPLIRLNLESRGDIALMNDKTQEISALIKEHS